MHRPGYATGTRRSACVGAICSVGSSGLRMVGGRVGGSGLLGLGVVGGVARPTTQHGVRADCRGEDEGGEQATDLVAAQRDQLVGTGAEPVPGVLFRCSVAFGSAGGGEVGCGQHRQRDVGAPGSIVADLVVVQADFVSEISSPLADARTPRADRPRRRARPTRRRHPRPDRAATGPSR